MEPIEFITYGVTQKTLSQFVDRSALPGHLVRFSIGLEGVDDLKADLEQALRALG